MKIHTDLKNTDTGFGIGFCVHMKIPHFYLKTSKNDTQKCVYFLCSLVFHQFQEFWGPRDLLKWTTLKSTSLMISCVLRILGSRRINLSKFRQNVKLCVFAVKIRCKNVCIFWCGYWNPDSMSEFWLQKVVTNLHTSFGASWPWNLGYFCLLLMFSRNYPYLTISWN